jgi:hypothetical protein
LSGALGQTIEGFWGAVSLGGVGMVLDIGASIPPFWQRRGCGMYGLQTFS